MSELNTTTKLWCEVTHAICCLEVAHKVHSVQEDPAVIDLVERALGLLRPVQKVLNDSEYVGRRQGTVRCPWCHKLHECDEDGVNQELCPEEAEARRDGRIVCRSTHRGITGHGQLDVTTGKVV